MNIFITDINYNAEPGLHAADIISDLIKALEVFIHLDHFI